MANQIVSLEEVRDKASWTEGERTFQFIWKHADQRDLKTKSSVIDSVEKQDAVQLKATQDFMDFNYQRKRYVSGTVAAKKLRSLSKMTKDKEEKPAMSLAEAGLSVEPVNRIAEIVDTVSNGQASAK